MRILLIVTMSLFLASCGFLQTKKEVVVTPVTKFHLELPGIDPISLFPVNWVIITPENVQDVFARLEKQGTDLVIFGLTDKGYENLSLNTGQIQRLITQQKTIIESYENYYNKEDATKEEKPSFKDRLKKLNPF